MRIAIIGASFARLAYLPALRHVDGAEVVAIASARLDSARSAAAEFNVPNAFDDWRAMLDNCRPDAVLIASPTDTHADMVLAALDAGAHVLCEKPTAMNAGEAAAMLDRAQSLGRTHMLGHELRFNPNRRRMAELIADGTLGEVRHVEIANIGSAWNDPASRPIGDWWSLAERGGGRLGANGSHQVDLARWWLGPVASVGATVRTFVADRVDPKTGTRWTATADDFVDMTLSMRSGAVVHIVMSAVAAGNFGNSTRVFGSKASLVLSNEDEKLYLIDAGGTPRDVSVADANDGLAGLRPGIWTVSQVAALRAFVSAAVARSLPDEGATFHDGLANQQVLDASLSASRERRVVDLPEERVRYVHA